MTYKELDKAIKRQLSELKKRMIAFWGMNPLSQTIREYEFMRYEPYTFCKQYSWTMNRLFRERGVEYRHLVMRGNLRRRFTT